MGIPVFIRHLGYLTFANLPGLLGFRHLNQLQIEWSSEGEIQPARNFLVVSNHRSVVDSWLVIAALFNRPRCLLRWHLLPHHPAAVEVYLSSPVKRLLFGELLKCIPIYRAGQDVDVLGTLDTLAARLMDGTMIVFPEGTRSRSGRVQHRAKWGVGRVIYHAHPTVVPVFLHGSDRVLPVGSRRLRLGQALQVLVGERLDLSAFYALPDEQPTWQRIADHALAAIIALESAFWSRQRRR